MPDENIRKLQPESAYFAHVFKKYNKFATRSVYFVHLLEKYNDFKIFGKVSLNLLQSVTQWVARPKSFTDISKHILETDCPLVRYFSSVQPSYKTLAYKIKKQ